MKRISAFFAVSALLASTAFGVDTQAQPSRRRGFPPEAFTTPTNFVALVNVHSAVDSLWLEEFSVSMQRSLQVGVKAIEIPSEIPLGDRAAALAFLQENPQFKISVFLWDEPQSFGAPVLSSPYEGWAAMDAGWVKRGGGDPETVSDRMGKRIYQTLGAFAGAGYRSEREAVMRFSPTPESLDECLSHNFHPLNVNAFSIVARYVGLDPVRLRPRAELEAEGIVPPRKPKPVAPADSAESEGATSVSPAANSTPEPDVSSQVAPLPSLP